MNILGIPTQDIILGAIVALIIGTVLTVTYIQFKRDMRKAKK